MDLTNSARNSAPPATVNEVGASETEESITDVAIAVDEEAYVCGWDDAIRAVLAAIRNASSAEPDYYFEGWMDAITQCPIDPNRSATARASYVIGYTEGAREHELAHHGGCDAE